MLTPVILTLMALAGAAPVQAADTVLAVERGHRLTVDVESGRVAVDAWDRDAVRVRAAAGPAPDVSRLGSVIRVRPRAARPGRADADYRITVPRWMDVRIEGNRLEVAVREVGGEVSVETVGGGVTVSGGAGRVVVRTIQGSVTVRGTRGRVEVMTVNDGVVVEDVDGDVSVETTNGGITMRRIRSGSVRATTVNGAVSFDGAVRDEGRYTFSTHNGNVTVTIPPAANATVSVATFNGEFQSEFPLRLTGASRDRQYHFTLGTGSARVELESFNGEIRLRRPR